MVVCVNPMQLPSENPLRTVYCEDALGWLESRGRLEGCSLITSLPDASEFPSRSLEEWKLWFIAAARRVLDSCPDEGVTIFFQTDIKPEGNWVDKGYLVQKAAEATGHELLWHKIVCRVRPGHATFGRPAYSHLLCFSRGVKAELSRSTADVLPEAGEIIWTRGMGTEACLAACRWVIENTGTRTIVDPFCGHGTVLAVANHLGLQAVGVDLGRKRAEKAAALEATKGLRLVSR
jgi:hypothetical protein